MTNDSRQPPRRMPAEWEPHRATWIAWPHFEPDWPGKLAPIPWVYGIARHKLLDLIGDLALYGGPPEGRIRAARPGHAATHHIVRNALFVGLLSRR